MEEIESLLSNLPSFTKEQYDNCRIQNDFRPILFEWYKYTGIVCNFYASISYYSQNIKKIPKLNYSILIGLLNRCTRLMLANIALSHKGYYGETVAIIDRCIFESALKLMWLCKKGNDESFIIYIADGLKTEIEFKNEIIKNISERNNCTQKIEKRMLNSIDSVIEQSGLNEQIITNSKRMPDLASIVNYIYDDRLLYIAGQKIRSYHVHGTFPNLIKYYLKKENEIYVLRDHNCKIQADQWVFISKFVLDAIIYFLHYTCVNTQDIEKLLILPKAIDNEIMKIYDEVVGSDFENIE